MSSRSGRCVAVSTGSTAHCCFSSFVVKIIRMRWRGGGACSETLRRASAAASSTWRERIEDNKVSRELGCRDIAEETQTFTSGQKAARKGVTATGFQGIREGFLKNGALLVQSRRNVGAPVCLLNAPTGQERRLTPFLCK